MVERYTAVARWYDLLSAEPVYRAGRRRAIAELGLRLGDRVLDVGCGTGLNVPLLSRAVGPGGLVVGVDRSRAMLDVARSKAAAAGLGQAQFVEADATRLSVAHVVGTLPSDEPGGFDAVIYTYSLSLMPDIEGAWCSTRALLRDGAGVAVVDMQRPTGVATVLTPVARVACWLGGADITARPWQRIEADLDDVRRWSLRGGHVQVSVGQAHAGSSS